MVSASDCRVCSTAWPHVIFAGKNEFGLANRQKTGWISLENRSATLGFSEDRWGINKTDLATYLKSSV